jgi:hypothetical protein
LGTRVAAHLLLDDEAIARHELLVFAHEGGDAYARLYHGLGFLEDDVVVCYLEDVEPSCGCASSWRARRAIVGDTVGKVLLANVKAGYKHIFSEEVHDLKSKSKSTYLLEISAIKKTDV